MDLVYLHYDKFVTTYQTENKEQRLMSIIVLGQKYYLGQILKGSILGPLLFNIFLTDFFLAVKDINVANYADFFYRGK